MFRVLGDERHVRLFHFSQPDSDLFAQRLPRDGCIGLSQCRVVSNPPVHLGVQPVVQLEQLAELLLDRHCLGVVRLGFRRHRRHERCQRSGREHVPHHFHAGKLACRLGVRPIQSRLRLLPPRKTPILRPTLARQDKK